MPHRHNEIPLVSCNGAASGSDRCYGNRCSFLLRESILLCQQICADSTFRISASLKSSPTVCCRCNGQLWTYSAAILLPGVYCKKFGWYTGILCHIGRTPLVGSIRIKLQIQNSTQLYGWIVFGIVQIANRIIRIFLPYSADQPPPLSSLSFF